MKVSKPRSGASIALTSLVLTLGLASCAPEPIEVAGTDKDSQIINPESEANEREVSEYEYTTELPSSFPSEEFVIPDTATIEDAGERGPDQWFLVLRAPDAELADSLWNEIVAGNSFVVAEESATVEGGRNAVFTGVTLTAQVLTIPQTDGSVQFSFDLQRFA